MNICWKLNYPQAIPDEFVSTGEQVMNAERRQICSDEETN